MNNLKLQDHLYDRVNKSKKEIYIAQRLVLEEKSEEVKSYLLRSWILSIYANCENFLKESSKIYLLYAKNNRSIIEDLRYLWLICRGKNTWAVKKDNKYVSFDDYKDMEYEKISSKVEEDIINAMGFNYCSMRFICDWVLRINIDYQGYRQLINRLVGAFHFCR